jgi:hypothetical protein
MQNTASGGIGVLQLGQVDDTGNLRTDRAAVMATQGRKLSER